MRTLRVALAQINTTVGALRENADCMIELIKRAEELQVDIIAFPELAVTGYPPEDLVLKPEFIRDNLRELDRIIASVGDLTAIVGFVDADGADVYNAAAVIQRGELVGCHHKFYLPNYSVFDELRYFKAGTEWTVFTVRGVKIGVTICEDIWYATGPGTWQARAGAEVIVNINASPYRAGKHVQRVTMAKQRGMDELTYVCHVNLVGGQDELVFEGASLISNQDGEVIVQGKFFEPDFLVADLDVDSVFSARLHDVRRRQEAPQIDAPGRLIDTPLAEPLNRPVLSPLPAHYCEVPDRLAEIYGALVLGTHDYVRKNGFKGVVVGLSGGIDSSLTAAIAVDALGPENVLGVSNPSRYSSEGSQTDAKQLARNLGIRYVTIPIEQIFGAYLDTLADVFGDLGPDVAEENLQARIRGNLWMALTNKRGGEVFGGLVLTAGNKSELAAGYSTLYGDMAGGFSVLKDVYKTTVYELAKYKNQSARREIIPQAVLDKAPSAELRPDQRDTDSLPPYSELDGILKLYVEDDRSATDIVALGYDAETVTRVISMVDHSEYKRRQAAPGIKISVRAFGKDRRLPITNRYRDLPEVGEEEKEALAEVAEQAHEQVAAGIE